MYKIESCIVLTSDEEARNEYKELFQSAHSEPEKVLSNHIKDGNIEYLNIKSCKEKFKSPDLLIIEDQWIHAALIVNSATKLEGFNNVIICTSPITTDFLIDRLQKDPLVITLDFKLLGLDDKDWTEKTEHLYKNIKKNWPNSSVIGFTGFEDHEITKTLTTYMRKNGDYVFPKNSELWNSIPHLLKNGKIISKLQIENQQIKEKIKNQNRKIEDQEALLKVAGIGHEAKLPNKSPVPYIIGNTPIMRAIYYSINIFKNEKIVVIQGESGTGKELVAKAIHELSDRSNKKLSIVNCGSIKNELLENEIFGHEEEGFTGANRYKKGILENANNGTVFLDQFESTNLPFQIALLRFLEHGEIKPVGSPETKVLDVKLIIATNISLDDLLEEKKLRLDLFYRLTKVITLPTLFERKEDIRILANYFLNQFSKERKKKTKSFTKSALNKLEQYRWNGNVRDLKETVDNAVLFAPHDIEEIDDDLIVFKNVKLKNDSTTGINEYLNSKLGKANEWLNALEKAILNLEKNGEKITQDNIGKVIKSPDRGGKVVSQRISQVFSEFEKQFQILLDLDKSKCPLFREYFFNNYKV